MEFTHTLHYAVIQQNYPKIQRLIHQVNEYDEYGYTPLHYASRNGYLDTCLLLIKNGACVNHLTRHGRVSCLHRALVGKHYYICELLLKSGGDPYCVDGDGRSCLDIVNTLDCRFHTLFQRYT